MARRAAKRKRKPIVINQFSELVEAINAKEAEANEERRQDNLGGDRNRPVSPSSAAS